MQSTHVRNQILADAASSMPDTFIAFASTAPRNVLIELAPAANAEGADRRENTESGIRGGSNTILSGQTRQSKRVCTAYWSGKPSNSPVWECLAPSFSVEEVLFQRPGQCRRNQRLRERSLILKALAHAMRVTLVAGSPSSAVCRQIVPEISQRQLDRQSRTRSARHRL